MEGVLKEMKRIILFIGFCIVAYSIYFDISVGTLPAYSSENMDKINENYYNIKVEPGDTVLSIIEKNEGTIPVPIDQMIEDFSLLNNGMNPEEIEIGQTYRFKNY
jgi:hypothetical protein